MVMHREVCPEGVQNKCPGGVWCRGFMSWGDTLILVISRGVQLYYGIAHCDNLHIPCTLGKFIVMLGYVFVFLAIPTTHP